MNEQTNCHSDLQVAEALRAIAGPVFAAIWADRAHGPTLVVHVSAGESQRQLKETILNALQNVTASKVQVRFHRPSSLLAAKSLEALVARLGGGRVAYDPTGSLVRANGLVAASRAVRGSLSERISGLYYAPLLRTFYVTLSKARVVLGEKVKLSDLAQIEHSVLGAISAAFAGSDTVCPAVRIGFGLPNTRLVPVDASSVIGWGARVAQAARQYWKPVTVAALFGFGAASVAQAQDPAVSESNLKIRGSFGEVIDDYSWNVEGAFTAPLGDRFGLQIEGGVGAQDGDSHYGAAAHLFMRDPESYLVGVFGAYGEADTFNIDATRLGGEFEFYLNDLTISGLAGYQFSSILGDKAFGGLDFKWYASDNFAITAGALGDEDQTFGRARLEWQPGFAALPGLAFNAEGTFGEDDYQSIMGGLTYYFGTPVTLKDRHRRQDPESALFGLFQATQAEKARLDAFYAQTPPPPPN